ncbi:MAG: hypothetical protein ABL974_05595 [Prosthecobacter sp.]
MNLLAPPSELIGQVTQSALGRGVCFLIACSLGRGAGYVVAHGWNMLIGMRELFEDPFFSDLGWALLIVPSRDLPSAWEIGAYVLCAPLIFVFVRFELALKWLLAPFLIMATASFASYLLTP